MGNKINYFVNFVVIMRLYNRMKYVPHFLVTPYTRENSLIAPLSKQTCPLQCCSNCLHIQSVTQYTIDKEVLKLIL